MAQWLRRVTTWLAEVAVSPRSDPGKECTPGERWRAMRSLDAPETTDNGPFTLVMASHVLAAGRLQFTPSVRSGGGGYV
jgi:hypothetical protein